MKTLVERLMSHCLVERRALVDAAISRGSVLRAPSAEVDRWEVARALVALASELRVEGLEHARRTAAWTRAIGEEMRLEASTLDACELGALLHDIGKIAVPDDVLHKPGLYDDDDWARLRVHSEVGAAVIEGIAGLEGAARVVRAHHEHWNGGGYPRRLAGVHIPLGARVFAVTDSYDAMTRTGPEREWGDPFTHDRAMRELRDLAGVRYDPCVVDAWERVVRAQHVGEVG